MRFTQQMVVGIVAAVLMTGIAQAEEGKPYVGFSAGAAIMDDSTLTDTFGDSAEASYSTGLSLSGVVGYAFTSGLRLEGEVNYRQADMDKLSAGGASADISCDVSSVAVMANAYYDFRNSSSFTPYLGFGVGFANIDAGKGTGGGFLLWESDDDTVFAYQLAVGAGIDLSRQLTLDLGYRYFTTQDPEFELVKADYSSHNLMVGLRYRF